MLCFFFFVSSAIFFLHCSILEVFCMDLEGIFELLYALYDLC